MFKSQRQQNKQPFTSRERVDFRFSNFQLLQVPKGWDRLLMTIISTETGKAIAKLGKAGVRNGGCQWTETLLESLWIPLDNYSTETAQCYFKFIISTGSAKPSILGEVTLNLARYVTSGMSASVSFPLKRCSYGTVMQVKIQCLTPRTKLRLEESNLLQPSEEIETEYHEVRSISNESDNSLSRSFGSSSSQNLGSTSRKGKLDRKGTSSSISSSNCSFDEGSTGRGNTLASEDESAIPNKSHFRKRALCPRANFPRIGNELASTTQENGNSSKNHMETAEGTTEELRAEAKMWERNARKLMVDVDVMTREFSEQSKKQADLVMELSAAYAEHDTLRKEIESFKVMLVEPKETQTSSEYFTLQSDGKEDLQKELENELTYQQQSNANLALQLKRSQESNVKLVSILKEMEETIEQQRIELDAKLLEGNNKDSNAHLVKVIEDLRGKMMELERDCDELTEENLDLLLKLKESQVESDVKGFELNGYDSLDGRSSQSISFEKFSELTRHLETIAQKMMKPWHDVAPEASDKLGCNLPDLPSVRNTDESVRSYLSELDNLLETKIGECEQRMRHNELEIQGKSSTIEEFQTKLDGYVLMVKEFDRLKSGLENDLRNLQVELSDRNSEIGELQADFLRKNLHNDSLIQHEQILQQEVTDLKKKNKDLEEKLENAMKESEVAFKNMDNMRNNLATLASSMDSHVSAKLVLDQQLLKVQKEKCELENQLSLSKEENLRFSEENMDLKKSNTELMQCCTEMEARLNESRRHFLDCSRKVENLEKGISMIQETFSLGEKRLNLEIEALHEANIKDIERLEMVGNQAYQMSEELKILQREVLSINEEKEKMAIETSNTLSNVLADKSRLEQDLHSAHEKGREAETELESLRVESKLKIEGLISDHEKKLLKNYKIYEEKLKIAVNDLELKLTVAEYERTHLEEEVTNFKIQLQKVTEFEDEITMLNEALTACKLEKEKIETMFESLCQSHEELEAEKQSYVEKIMELEEDLAANMDLRNEFCGIKKANERYLNKIQKLEQEKDDLLMRAQEHQESLRLLEEKQILFPKEEDEYTSNQLKELQDRYFQMSLKYAEVEAQREDLVMQLKASKSGKGWFS